MWRGWYVEAGWPSIPAALQHVHSALTVGCTATEGNWMTFWKSSDGTGCAPLRFVPQTAGVCMITTATSSAYVVMFAFQWKNLLDSEYFDDGLIFVIHHSGVVVSLFALHLLAFIWILLLRRVRGVYHGAGCCRLFDAKHGVEELERDFEYSLVIGRVLPYHCT